MGRLTGSLPAVPPRATGTIETYPWRDGQTVTYRLRVRYQGQRHRIDLGTNHEGWNEARAQVELDHVQAQIRRGTWQAPTQTTAVSAPVRDQETFHVFASRWWAEKRETLTPNARADYEWRLAHLLGHLAPRLVADLKRRDVDDYRALKIAERTNGIANGRRKPLSNRSINMTLELLAQILDQAVSWELLDSNPARGRGVRLKVDKPQRNFLDSEMVVDLLNAAGTWETGLPPHQRYGRRALLALLALAGGPRITEAIQARRGDLDLTVGRWRIPDSKTQAGHRDVELPLFVVDELSTHLAARTTKLGRQLQPDDLVFATSRNKPLNPSNIRNRLLAGACAKANEQRATTEAMRLPANVTPHTLRRTFASMCFWAGRDPRWVMSQIGHEDARLTLEVYAQAIDRRVNKPLVWSLMRFADEPELVGTDTQHRPVDAPRSRHAHR